MNEKYLNDVLGRISTQNLDDALSYRKRRISFKAVTALAAAIAVMIGAGVYLYGKNTKVPTAPSVSSVAADSGYGGESTPTTDGGYGGESTSTTGGAECDATLSPTGEITYDGLAFTDEEIAELLKTNKEKIAQYIVSEAKDLSGELRIATKGYCHVQAYGNAISLESMTLPVFTEDNRIVGEVQLFRFDEEPHYSVAAGGPSWDWLTEIIAKHKGEKLAFVYVGGITEDVIAPDNTVYPRLEGGDTELESISNAYDAYAKEENTFCLADCVKEKDYVSVKL